MADFQEDMLFENVSEEDVSGILEIMGKKSKKITLLTNELEYADSSYFRPDLILELDDSIEIIKFQNSPVDDDFSKKCHYYVTITDQKKKNNKQIILSVLSTAEDSKIVEYRYNDLNVFRYEVFGLKSIKNKNNL